MENGMIPEFMPMRKDLLARELHSEVVLYDSNTRKAHCLNQTAAAVWRLCNGTKSVEEIARALGQDPAAPVDEGLVWLAVRQFDKSGLLQNKITPGAERNLLSRRELVKKMGTGAVLALPIATTILVPTPAAAVSAKPGHPASSRRPQRSAYGRID